MGSSQRSKRTRKRTRRSKSLVKYHGRKTLSQSTESTIPLMKPADVSHCIDHTYSKLNFTITDEHSYACVSTSEHNRDYCSQLNTFHVEAESVPSTSGQQSCVSISSEQEINNESSTEVDLDAVWGSQEEYER
ncbi:hypothetical protein FQR65_LT16533 [Abscondita terminalis]|nr:hypothetical protein FQR65_LT16533 [Abscondita terminalis]